MVVHQPLLLHRDGFPVLRGKHLGYDDIDYLRCRVKVRYSGLFKENKRFISRTIVFNSDLQRIDYWYYGDTHYYSNFTDNPYESNYKRPGDIPLLVDFRVVTSNDFEEDGLNKHRKEVKK